MKRVEERILTQRDFLMSSREREGETVAEYCLLSPYATIVII